MKKAKLKLKFGEVICNECSGLGRKSGTNSICEKCDGDGKLDWVENIVGKRKKQFDWLEEDVVKHLVNQMAKKIDEEIVKEYLEKEKSRYGSI